MKITASSAGSSILVCCSHMLAAEVDVGRLPAPATNAIVFERDIQPIFEKSCLRCHGPEKPKSRFRLDNRESALKGGEQGVAIIPGKSAESPLVHYVAGLAPEMEMPPKGKGDPLRSEQVALLRAWIDQGAPWGEGGTASTSYVTVSPTIQWIAVSGHQATFREHQWRREGLTGGVEDFEIREPLGERARAFVNGRALRDEYRVSLALEWDDIGFVRGGAEEFHKFSSDAGGYHPAISPSAPSLNRDLRLDVGRAWIDLGLTVPELPRVVVGYEYQYRQGNKSTLQWGDLTNATGTLSRKIYPSVKAIDEDVHILKADVSYILGGFLLEDNFRGEFYDLDTRRRNRTAFAAGLTPGDQEIRESQSWFHGANTFRVEKPVNDWLLLTGGYLYSSLNSDAAFRQHADLPSLGTTLEMTSDRIVLERDSHVVNLGSLLGPWHGLSLAAGAQAEWMRQQGMGRAMELLAAFPPPNFPVYNADIDRATVQEQARLHYSGLPFTTLFAEARLQQESIGQYEEFFGPTLAGISDFLRDTDASSDVREWRAGFSTSPWTRTTLTAHFHEYQKFATYKHLLDVVPPGNNNRNEGYSAFIRSRDVSTDEVEARLALRPARWLKATLGYRYVKTDFWTETDPEPSQAVTRGGWILAGDQDAHIYSASAVLTPMPRLYWSTTLAYHDTSTVAADNGSDVVVPYHGHVYNVLSSATFALNQQMDLHGTYTFSYADYGQNNFAAGLPLGLEFRRHGVEVGVTRRWLKTISTRLQYGWYTYDEPSSGGFTDYTAHAVFATLTLRWP
jgi:hypothetical protein